MTDAPPLTQRWVDHLEICELLARFAQGLDSRDAATYRSVWLDEIEVDYSSWRPDEPARRLRSDDWVARNLETMHGLDGTRHTLTNIRTRIDGDHATVAAYVQASHYLHTDQGESTFVLHGEYRDRLARTPEGWRIAAVSLQVAWVTGNKWIMTTAKDRARERREAAGQA